MQRRRRPDRDRAHPARARAPRRLPRALLHRGASGRTASRGRIPPQHYAGRFAGKEAVGKALGCGVHFTWKEIEIAGRPKPGVHARPAGRCAWAERVGRGRDRPLDDALARARRRDLRRPRRGNRTGCSSRSTRRRRCGRPRSGTTGTVGELMERAGARGRARRRSRRFPDARRSPWSAARARTAATGGSPRASLREAGPRRVVGRSRTSEPRRRRTSSSTRSSAPASAGSRAPEAAALIERMNAARRAGRRGRPALRRRRLDRRGRRRGRPTPTLTVTFHGAEGRARGRARALPRRRGRRRRHRARADRDTQHRLVTARRSCGSSRARRRERHEVHGRLACSSSAARRGMTGRRVPDRARGVPRRRRLRRGRRAAPSRSPVLETRVLEAVKRPLRGRRRCATLGRARGARAARRARARARAHATRRASSCARLLERLDAAGRRRRRRALRARAVRARRADACSRRTPASSPGCSAATRTGSTRTGSRRCARRVERFGCVVLLKGADTLVARAGRGVLVRRLRHGRRSRPPARATCSPGVVARVPRQGARAALAAAAAAVGARPRGRAVGASGRPGSSPPTSSTRSRRARLGLKARLQPLAQITIDLGALRRNARRCSRARRRGAVGGRQGRRLRPRRGGRRAAPRSRPARRALCVATVAEAVALRAALPERAHPRPRPDATRTTAGRARGAARADRRRTAASPRASRCT